MDRTGRAGILLLARNFNAQLGLCEIRSFALAHMKPWLRSPALCKLDLIAHACNPSTGEVEAGGPEV